MTDDENPEESLPRPSRRAVLAATATAIATAAPVSASTSSGAVGGTLTLAAIEASLDPRARSDDLGELHESRGDPTWIVEYSEGELPSLEEWATEDGREILSAYTHGPSRTAVVRATVRDVGGDWLSRTFTGGGLASRSYVETIDANPRLSLAEPIDELETESEAWPDYGTLDKWLRFGGDLPVAAGIAFDDVDSATMADVRSVHNADGLDDSPTIAVVDSGVNTSGGRLFDDTLGLSDGADGTRVLETSKNMISGETVSESGLGAIEDRHGHGTFVSAEVAGDPPNADHAGILPNGKILGIKALDDEGTGATSDISRAIRYAADQGSDSIVLSLGSPAWSHELDRAIEYAAGAGTISVAAVGNDRYGTRWVAAPSSTQRAIAVASTTAGVGDAEIRSSYYSNVGPNPGSGDLSGGESAGASVYVSATGHKVETTVADVNGDLSTATKSGTSMSAPVVGAIAAILGTSDPDEARETLEDAARPIEVAAEAEVGAGVLDADRALSGGVSDETQSEAMNDDATARDDAYRTESDSRGRKVLEWF